MYHYVNPGRKVYCLLDAYEEERTFEEIAEILCVSKERVRQIAAKAERRAKRYLRIIHQDFPSP